jgi:hypothetical protein
MATVRESEVMDDMFHFVKIHTSRNHAQILYSVPLASAQMETAYTLLVIIANCLSMLCLHCYTPAISKYLKKIRKDPQRYFSWFSSVHPGNCLKLAYARFIPHPSYSIIQHLLTLQSQSY